MRWLFDLAIVAAVLFLSCGCGPSRNAMAATTVARIANDSAIVIRDAYQADTRPDRELRWEPLLYEWDRMRELHDAAATQIERGEDPDLSTVLDAFCNVVDAAPPELSRKLTLGAPGVCQ